MSRDAIQSNYSNMTIKANSHTIKHEAITTISISLPAVDPLKYDRFKIQLNGMEDKYIADGTIVSMWYLFNPPLLPNISLTLLQFYQLMDSDCAALLLNYARGGYDLIQPNVCNAVLEYRNVQTYLYTTSHGSV